MPSKKRLQYRYTPTGQRFALVDMDGGRFTCTYDAVKRITQVQNPQGERTSYSYDPAGRRTAKKLANGSRTSYTYDAAGQMTTVAHLKSNGTQQARFDYVYDEVGNRTNMVELDGSRVTWTYDVLDQLTGEHRTGTNGYRHTFTYDTRGNRLVKNLDGVRTTSTYDAANQLRYTQDAGGRTTYVFDADGNQQVVIAPSLARTTSVWDYENKLTGVLNPSGTRETMAYDPDGKRIKHQTATDTVKYVWDQENYLAETNASDVTQVVYTNEPRTYGNLISQRKLGTTHYYLFDALGSTRLLTDSSEAVSESLLYDAWGNLVGASPSLAVPFRWVGELGYLFVPSTGDYSVRERIYRPVIGRWISQDPLGFIDGANRLVYVLNQLMNAVDASGFGLITEFDEMYPDLDPHHSWVNPPPAPGSPEWDAKLNEIGTRLGERMNVPEPSTCSYCGPDADGLLAAEINYAIRFWARHVRAYTSSLPRYTWYRSFVRWRHMLQIGLQLDWTQLASSPFVEGGVPLSCPTRSCQNTYRICGRCVHDHFIGNLMYGLWIKLHGFQQVTGFYAGEGAQLILPTDDPGFDKRWDRAGYVLGFRVFNARENGQNVTEETLCAILKKDGDGDAWYEMANETGRDLSHCLPCPEGLDGGVSNWSKESIPGGDYSPF